MLRILACSFFLISGSFVSAESYPVITLSGMAPGYVDGIGSEARFRSPEGIAVDGAGNVFVADTQNHTIRKITPQGVVTTLAGQVGIFGHQDGIGADAILNHPNAMTVDSGGNVYVLTAGGAGLRRIEPDGTVTTSAFFGSYSPGVVIDAAGNVFATDMLNHAVLRRGIDGSLTTFAGMAGVSGNADGTGGSARFSSPTSLAIDGSGNLYVADSANNTVRKITPGGEVTTIAGIAGTAGYLDGPVSTAQFSWPEGIAIDRSGNLYVGDNSVTVRKIAGGTVTTLAGSEGKKGWVDGLTSSARFTSTRDIATDGSGNVYVADTESSTIRKITPAGLVTTLAGSTSRVSVDAAVGLARFLRPMGIAVDGARNLYITDSYGNTVRKISAGGEVTTIAGNPGVAGTADGPGADARFLGPDGVACDTLGNLYVADSYNNTIRKIAPGGTVTTLAGLARSAGSNDGLGSSARFDHPEGVAVDRAGNVFVADGGNSTIRKITPSGEVSTFAGKAGQRAIVDGTAGDARFIAPFGLAMDESDNLYLTDSVSTIRKITPAGVVSTIAGSNQSGGGYSDGPGSGASFTAPQGIAVDRDGNLFVADTGNSTIRQISPDYTVTTIAGAAPQGGSNDGSGTAAKFYRPEGIAVDRLGNIYIADTENNTIRKIIRGRVTPTITWNPPASIVAGTTLSPAQLGASANLPGTLSYHPADTATLPAGTHILQVTFTPTNFVEYGIAVAQAYLTVLPAATTSLVNIATRAYCGVGDNVTIGGFVISDGAPKRVLVRGVGPTLTARGLAQSEVLLDPMIEVHAGAQGVIASNDNWSDGGNSAEILTVSAEIGAGALSSTDIQSSALLLTLNPGAYTFIARGKNNTSGIVLLEVYDADPATHPAKFVNIATRANATTGNGVTIGGFVISGSIPKQVLLRGVGPTLTTMGITASQVLTDPMIELHGTVGGVPTKLGENDNWGTNANAALITSVGARIGAAPIHITDTASAALVVTLNPGAYTFIASGKAGTSGIVLVEVYDAD